MNPTFPTGGLSDDERILVDRFAAAGQGHVFRFLPTLDTSDRAALTAQAREIDLELVARLAALAEGTRAAAPDSEAIEPAEVTRPDRTPPETLAEARREGERLLSEGRVAAILVAGGQGTRLGFPGPKGAYPIGPVTERTLFDWFADRLLAIAARYGKPIPLYVMTSDATHDETVAFFRERDALGLGEANVRFFRQGMVPALTDDGSMILETPSRIFLNPNGHGGVFEALLSSGSLADMAARGVEELFYFQVDNVLVRIGDPLFLGLHRLSGAQMSSKVVEKAGPEEKVGVVARQGGRLGVVEYSELTPEQMKARDADGGLKLGAGSIAIHAIRRDFAERIATVEDLPFHLARKAVPHVDEAGRPVRPTEPNATKFERFVFDALPLAERAVTLQVDRDEEFAPVKNGEGADSPATARAALTRLFARWYEAAGLPIVTAQLSGAETSLEIDPRFALDADALRERLDGGAT